MEQLILVKPSMEWKEKALDYKNEHIRSNETNLHASALLDSMEYEPWLKLNKENAHKETVHSNWVQASTFFVVRVEDERIIGMVDIRHSLNEFLASYGGHIGYGVRPSERRKGYGTRILQMALQYAKEIGLQKVMVACNKDNIGSRTIIQSCGGMKETEFVYTDGKTVEKYWILCNTITG